MTTLATDAERLDIGRVIEQLFAVLRRNFVTFGLLALVLTGIPAFVVNLLAPQGTADGSATGAAWLLTSTLISIVAGLVLQGALIYATIGDLTGRRVGAAEGLSVGMHNLLPLLGVAVLSCLAVFLGCLLLIVPGVMIAVAWAVAVPVLIAERRRITETFGRSAELTRGSRWRIFGLGLLFVAMMLVLKIVASVAGEVAGVTGALVPGALPLQQALIHMATSVIAALVGATGGAVLYVELRRLRDGVGPEALTAIFD